MHLEFVEDVPIVAFDRTHGEEPHTHIFEILAAAVDDQDRLLPGKTLESRTRKIKSVGVFFLPHAQRSMTNADIAARLVLCPKTVRNHVGNLMSKLQVADRAEALLRARDV